MKPRILVVDDEPNITRSFSSLLRDEGYLPSTAASAEEASKMVSPGLFELILLDLNLPGRSGLEFLRQLKDEPQAPLVLVVSGQAEISTALEAVKLGAVDYLEKPVPPDKLLASVRSALMLAAANRQRNLLVDDLDFRSQIIGQSRPIKRLIQMIQQVAVSDATVLITGENGTGKELVAARVYLESPRRDMPFIKVNCPGIPESLFESELFGHKKGAFTGAVKDFPGKFVLAHGGTIFLDEIGDLPLESQAKLLRVLETGELETLGAVDRKQVDVRVICATNRDLRQLVADGKFREDLYYRVSVLVLDVPPLRTRREDIPLLMGEFLKRFDPSGRTKLSAEAVAYLTTLDYPGNVRQLKNIMERVTILTPGRTVGIDDLVSAAPLVTLGAGRAGDDVALPLFDKVRNFEKQLIKQALNDCGGNISQAARILGVDRANLSKKIHELDLKSE